MFGQRFLPTIRQYAALESRMHQDFSEPIKQLAVIEVERQVVAGVDRFEALTAVNGALKNEVQRFPVQLENSDFIPF